MGNKKKGLALALVLLMVPGQAAWPAAFDAEAKVKVKSLDFSDGNEMPVIPAGEALFSSVQEEVPNRVQDPSDWTEGTFGWEEEHTGGQEGMSGQEADIPDRQEEMSGQEADIPDKQEEMSGQEADVSDKQEEMTGQGADMPDPEEDIQGFVPGFGEDKEELPGSGTPGADPGQEEEAGSFLPTGDDPFPSGAEGEQTDKDPASDEGFTGGFAEETGESGLPVTGESVLSDRGEEEWTDTFAAGYSDEEEVFHSGEAPEETAAETADAEAQAQDDSADGLEQLAERTAAEAVGDGEAIDNWSLGMVYYDSFSVSGSDPIPVSETVVWNASGTLEKRRLTIQINYRNDNCAKDYEPGEIEILLDDLAWLYAPERYAEIITSQIAADEYTSYNKTRDWSYRRFTDPDTGRHRISFTNNRKLEKDTNFEGSIQIGWELAPGLGITGHSFSVDAEMMGERALPLRMEFSSTPKEYSAVKRPLRISSLDGLPEGDLIWVRFEMAAEAGQTAAGVRFLDPSTVWFQDVFPENVVVLDRNMQPLSPEEDGCYRIAPDPATYLMNYENQSIKAVIYAGYPREAYGTSRAVNRVEVYGAYHSQNACSGAGEEIVMAAEAQCEFAVADFIFQYEGDLYSVNKNSSGHYLSSGRIREGSETVSFSIGGSAVYTGRPMTVRIGDDLTGILYSNGLFRFLTDEEAAFSTVQIPSFVNMNGLPLSPENFRCVLYVRDAGLQEYRVYAEYTDNEARTVSFQEDERIAGWYIELPDLGESLQISNSQTERIRTMVGIHDTGATDTGTVYDFCYMQIYIGGQPQISASLDNYGNELTREQVGVHDISVYGRYMLRGWASSDFRQAQTGLGIDKSFTSFSKDAEAETFRAKVSLQLRFAHTRTNGFNTTFRGYQIYDLLPEGMTASRPDYYTMVGSAPAIQYIRKADGSGFSRLNEYVAYVREHTRMDVTENWKGTGRTMVRFIVDYADSPLDISALSSLPMYPNQSVIQSLTDVKISFDVAVSFDAYLEYGSSWTNRAYMSEYGIDNYADSQGVQVDTSYYVKDDGTRDPGAVDVDEDGITDEFFFWNGDTRTIVDTASTHQDVTTYVQTAVRDYTTGTAISPALETYSYKLRVRTGEDRVTSLVIYDSLETANEDGLCWQGEFEGVDTSYALSKGYRVETWYSTDPEAGDLSLDSSWQLLSPDTPGNQVKSLAFSFLDEDGRPAVLPAQSMTYVLVRMRAPASAPAGSLASNRCRTQWNALDGVGQPVYDITGIRSNIVHVSLSVPDQLLSLSLIKKIPVNQIVWAHGDPVFAFEAEGMDDQGERHRYVAFMQFTQEDRPEEGYLTGTIRMEVPAGTWQVKELPCLRYRLEGISEVVNGEISGESVVFTLDAGEQPSGSAVFENRCGTQEHLSDCAMVRNVIG